ncbi:helix-turn-helix domain-containing protein [Sphingopyxis sp. RIFCSPHIGHO2_12_FULL_65_19]|uniref:helix-turn-helix domain-containing protein n=1 Tax=Sphingopyxis sp. RIFCSPHIGHO2_12_FULL_65_19 TaxID=1802172 RepID=UPI0025E5046B|nr:helix-turn-helix domain-containing protein [Sphingopyxis sp. RIFCSPHIGHO2_12_FULL_65_19]
MLEDFMTPGETAARLSTTEGTLRWMRCKGKGPPFLKKGRFVLYRRDDVDEYAIGKERGAAENLDTRP